MSASKVTRRNFLWSSLALPTATVVGSQLETVKQILPLPAPHEAHKITLSELTGYERVALFGLPGEGINELSEKLLERSTNRDGFDDQNIGASAQSMAFWNRLNSELEVLQEGSKVTFTFQDVYTPETLDRIIDTLQPHGFKMVRVVPREFEKAISKVAEQYSISKSEGSLADCYGSIFYRLFERSNAPYLEWSA